MQSVHRGKKSLHPAEEEMKDREKERKSSNLREVRNVKVKCIISYYTIMCPIPDSRTD